MAAWPESLPLFPTPLSHEKQDGVLRTPMDTGPAKARRRFTATAEPYSFTMRMNGAQYSTLQAFYDNNLEFQITDLTGTEEDYRFLSPPSGTVIVGDADPDKRIWNVNINIEKLP